MILDYATLRVVWWVLIGALLIGWAIADGMDMGVGNLLLFIGKSDTDRRVMINTVGPHWDGNQVWLITAGGAIFAAWPLVYAVAFSGFYMAMLLVLFALFFRPVGFDYRSKIDKPGWRLAWDIGIFAGGAIPSLIFGVAFGNLLQGVPFQFDEFMRSHYDGSLLGALLPLLNPFALLSGVISVAMLTMHGGVWVQMRTDGPLAQRAKTAVTIMGLVAFVGFALGGVWQAHGLPGYHIVSQQALDAPSNPLRKVVEMGPGLWLSVYDRMPWSITAPVLGLGGILVTLLLSRLNRPGLAFFTSALSLAGIIGTAGLSMFPFLIPSSINPASSLTVWDATSSPLTLSVMVCATVILLPIVLAYTIWCYWHMWGKVTGSDIETRSHSAY